MKTDMSNCHESLASIHAALDELEKELSGSSGRTAHKPSPYTGMSVGQAAVAVLKAKATVHAMRTSEIVDALRTGGVEYTGRFLYQAVYGYLGQQASKRGGSVKHGLLGGTWIYRGKK